MLKTVTYYFLTVTLLYLVLTFIYESSNPIDQYYRVIGEEINSDSLVFVKVRIVREMLDNETYYYYESGSKRSPNTYLDTSWIYYFMGICRNNLSQPMYLKDVLVFYDASNIEYPWKMAISANRNGPSTNIGNYIKGNSTFDIEIRKHFWFEGESKEVKDSIENIIIASHNMKAILITTLGKIEIMPKSYRVENIKLPK